MINYTNKLDLSKAIKNKEQVLDKLYQKFKFDNSLSKIQMLGLYIYPDGRLIDLSSHEIVDKYLINEGDIKLLTPAYQDVNEGSQFMDYCNCVRVRWKPNLELAWILLPELVLTEAQIRHLTLIIDQVLYTNTNLLIGDLAGTWSKNYSKNYFDFTDDIIKEVRQSYRGV